MTVLLLGSTGYVGQAFFKELQLQGVPVENPSRSQLDYTQYDLLARYLEAHRPAFLINAAGYTGRPNVDACETARAETLQGNTLLPLTISHACSATGTPWGHVSSGCIYNGAYVGQGNARRIEFDLTTAELRDIVATNPGTIGGFAESDEPNFSFRRPPCSFYSGTKALAEEALCKDPNVYVWRLRIPFDEFDNSRNFLSKLQRYAKVYDNVNSISHRADFVRACLELWRRRAPFGIYNLTNPGFVTSRQVVGMIQRILRPPRQFEFWQDDDEFYRMGAVTPRSNCVLDTGKLLATGVRMRSVEEALSDALSCWKAEA